MKRTDGLYDISRRGFVTLAGAGGLGLAVGCGGTSGSSDPDAAIVQPDAPAGGACATTGADVGAASTFVLGKPVLIAAKKLWIVRDAGGLYAMSAACTHEGVTTCIGSATACSSTGTQLYCTRHGAGFSFTGAVLKGPATQPLPHYAMCTLANGNIGVLTTMTVPATTRFNA
jgi:nitrite reductase/ring-hydroxylating ferredoxin subunit